MPVIPEASELEAARSATVAISERDYVEAMRMAEEIGKVKMAQAMAGGLTLTVVRWFASAKESGFYKGKTLIGPDNKVFLPETFEQLCEGMGFSRQTIDEHLRNYAELGERCLTEVRELGLTVRDTRKLRKALKDVPEEEKRLALDALKDSAPEELKTALDVVCAQYAKTKDDAKKLEKKAKELEEAVSGLKEDITTKDTVAAERNQQIDDLKEQLIRATSPVPADALVRTRQKNENAREQIETLCRDILIATGKLGNAAAASFADAEVDEDTAAFIHGRVSLLVKDMAGIVLDAGVDVDLTTEFVLPELSELAEPLDPCESDAEER